MLSASKVSDRLRHALENDGDFPARAAIVSRLIQLAESSDSTVEQISNVILSEPSLGTRILSLVNSAFYRRAEPVVTVSQAVVQLGMKSISQLCANLVIMDKFSPKSKNALVLSENIKRSVLTSLLSGSLAKRSGDAELAFLAGTFHDLGFLLLSFYFPQVYEAAINRDTLRNRGVIKSISEILGVSRADLNRTVLEALPVPDIYQQVLFYSDKVDELQKADVDPKVPFLTGCVVLAGRLAEAIVESKTSEVYCHAIEDAIENSEWDKSNVSEAMTLLPSVFNDHCRLIDMPSLTLPTFLLMPFREQKTENPSETGEQTETEFPEIQHAVENGDPIHSIIGLVMESLVYEFNFQRALFLEQFSTSANPRCKMFLGELEEADPAKLPLPKYNDRADLKAMSSGELTFHGKHLFKDKQTFVALPINQPNLVPAAIYADRASNEPISEEELMKLFAIHNILAKKQSA